MTRLWLALLLPLAFGCVSAIDTARTTLTTAAYATVQVDKIFADAYEIAADAARNSSTTQAEKDAKMALWTSAANRMEGVLNEARRELTVAELGIDAWETTGESGSWDEALACVAQALRRAADVLEERGVKIPSALAKVLSVSRGLVCSR